jgi:hypothetical protein
MRRNRVVLDCWSDLINFCVGGFCMNLSKRFKFQAGGWIEDVRYTRAWIQAAQLTEEFSFLSSENEAF